MSWTQFKKPNGKRMLLNMDLTFCFDEQDDGSLLAVSITGAGAPVGITMDEVTATMQEQDGP
jgi:hypothetical protein